MAGMGDFLKNPAMLKQAMDMLKNNPEMMKQMMGGMGASPTKSNKDDSLKDTEYNYDDKVMTCNLNNETYNNKEGRVKSYNVEKSRFEVFIVEHDKSIFIKPENLEKQTEAVPDEAEVIPDIIEPESIPDNLDPPVPHELNDLD